MLTSKIQKLVDKGLVNEQSQYLNEVVFCGWLLQKPRIINNQKGTKSASFILHKFTMNQRGTYGKTYSAITYVRNTVDQMEKLETVTMLKINATLEWSRKLRMYYPQVLKVTFLTETEIPLAPPYERKGKENA